MTFYDETMPIIQKTEPEDAWTLIDTKQLVNGYLHLPTNDPLPVMDDESSDAALLDQLQQNHDTLILRDSAGGAQPKASANKSSVIVNFGPDSGTTVSSLTRATPNNVEHSGSNNNNVTSSKNSDSVNIIKSNSKYKFNLFKFSSGSNSAGGRGYGGNRNGQRLKIAAVAFLVLAVVLGAVAAGAFFAGIYFSGESYFILIKSSTELMHLQLWI